MKHALILLAMAGCLPASTLTLTPSSTVVKVGETLSVNIDIDSATSLYDFLLDLTFDPKVLRVIAINEGSLFFNTGASAFDPGTIDNTAGTVTGIFDTLFGPDGVSGPGTLATANFSAIGNGNTSVAISPNDLGDLVVQSFDQANNGAGQLPVNTVPVSILSGSTPEPSTAILLAVPFAGLIALYKRRSAGDSTAE